MTNRFIDGVGSRAVLMSLLPIDRVLLVECMRAATGMASWEDGTALVMEHYIRAIVAGSRGGEA